MLSKRNVLQKVAARFDSRPARTLGNVGGFGKFAH